MKRLFKSGLILVTLVSLLCTPVFAAVQTTNVGNVDEQLKAKGVPIELIQMMPIEQKLEIVENVVKFDSFQKISVPSEMTSNNDISPRGTIPEDMFQLYITVYSAPSAPDGHLRKTVYSNYIWQKTPQIALTDPYGIAWSSLWKPVDNTSITMQYYKKSNGEVNQTESHSIAYAAVNGVGWNADIQWNPTMAYSQSNYGYSGLTIEATNEGALPTTDQLFTNYAHVFGNGTIGLTFGPLQVQYSGSASSDTRGTFLTFGL